MGILLNFVLPSSVFVTSVTFLVFFIGAIYSLFGLPESKCYNSESNYSPTSFYVLLLNFLITFTIFTTAISFYYIDFPLLFSFFRTKPKEQKIEKQE